MTLKNTPERWGGISQLLHWTVMVLIAAMAYLGLTMGDLPNGPDKIKTYALHKSIGLTVLGLVALRLLWRWYAGTPRPEAGTPVWQARIASLTHAAIYLLLFAIPLSGWVLNSAAGFPLQWFGLVNMPALVEKSLELREWAEDAHELMFWALMLLVAAHAGAAFFHHLFMRDATLARMLPRGWVKLEARTSGLSTPPPSSDGGPPSSGSSSPPQP